MAGASIVRSMIRSRIVQRWALIFTAACIATHMNYHLMKSSHEASKEDCFNQEEDSDELVEPVFSEIGKSRREEEILGCTVNKDIIYKGEVRVAGKPLKEKVFLTIGLPTVERTYKNVSVSYLEVTLNSLIKKLKPQEMEQVLIVIFLADLDSNARARIQAKLESQFKKYIERNLIHVIEAPSGFYPPLTGLVPTFNDKSERMFWRSKQNMDYVFLFDYCEGLSEYYLQLEDDVTTELKFLDRIKHFIKIHEHKSWTYLLFSGQGFIAKLFRNEHLRYMSRLWRTYYSDIPCDWILMNYRQWLGHEGGLRFGYGEEIFKHIGYKSSSLGT